MSAPNPLAALAPLITARKLAKQLDETIARLILDYRQAGYSWEDIGTALGVSRQAVHQRYGPLCRAAGLPEEAGDVPAQQ